MNFKHMPELEWQWGYPMILARAEGPIEPPSREWAATFNSYSTDLPEGAAEFEAELALSFPGRRQARTVVQGTLSVPRVEATRADLAGHHSYNFQLNGEVLRAGKLFDSFRYRFDLPAVELESEALPLVFERYLRPGDYTLILKLEDLNSQRFWRDERTLDVPALEPGAAPVLAPETARLLEEANAAVSVAEVTLKLIVPRSEMQAGLVRFDALTTGEGIDEVVFTLDGRPVLTKNRPPFSVELDLGNLPRPHTLRAEARNPAGEMLVADEVIVNASAHRFAVRLTEPRPKANQLAAVDAEKLEQIERAENVLKDLGFGVCRVRHHGAVATIEIPHSEFPRLFERELWRCAAERIREAGFSFVTLDLEGFRSGKLNDAISPPNEIDPARS